MLEGVPGLATVAQIVLVRAGSTGMAAATLVA